MALDAEVIKEDVKRLVLGFVNDFIRPFPNDCIYSESEIKNHLTENGRYNGRKLRETDFQYIFEDVMEELTQKELIKEIPGRGYASFAYNGNRN